LSYPDLRNFIKIELARTIVENYENVEVIAGVATGAIAQGAMVADALNLPFVYVRSTPKDHGLENLIEGDLKPGAKVVVIEDLISTGGSSLKAVEAIRSAGCHVAGMVAIFTYGFPVATKRLEDAKINLTTLCHYDAVLDEALKTDYIDESEIKTLQEWRKDPAHWNKNK
jgi:orotate phosphoribosyltransferase